MKTHRRSLSCWRCGADIESVPRPFSRFAECPECKCELHVCRMCRHYDTRYVGQCSHDFADKVLEKEKSNFCGHFRPDPDAYQGGDRSGKAQAQEALSSLFGDGGPEEEASEAGSDSDEPESESDAAKKRLKDLFGDG